MLILARYVNETIVLGSCRVTVLGVVRRKHGRTRVKLGIEAPPEIKILRAELPSRETVQKGNVPPYLERNPNTFRGTKKTFGINAET
jgi:carbon storage regulator CsrA